MTDKERIRKEVERLRSFHQMKYQQLDADSSMSLVECGKRNLCNELLLFIDSLQEEHVSDDFEMALTEMIDKAQKCVVEPIVVAQQWKDYLVHLAKSEEPVKDRFAFKAIPRLLDMIEPTDRAKSYVAKLADAFDSEGYYTDAKIVRESLKIMNGEKVAMATMDEEPVSEELK